MYFIKDQFRPRNSTCHFDVSMSMSTSQSNFSPIPSTSKQNDLETVKIEETTHVAFLKEFPKSGKLNLTKEFEEKQKREFWMASIDPDLGFLAGLLPHFKNVLETDKPFLEKDLLQVISRYLSKKKYLDSIATLNNGSENRVVEESPQSPQPSTSNFCKRKLVYRDKRPYKKTNNTAEE